MRLGHQIRLSILLAASGLLIGCAPSEEISAPDGTATGHFQLQLVDAPAEFDDLILDVQGVSVHNADPGQQGGWYEVGMAPGAGKLLNGSARWLSRGSGSGPSRAPGYGSGLPATSE